MTQEKSSFPIVKVVGMLSACGVTLIGVVMGLSPEVILVRVIFATVSIAIVTYLAGKLISIMMT